jgi:hypothetical protein
MMCPAASFHGDDARRQVFCECSDAGWSHAVPLDHGALAVQRRETAAVLSQVDPNNCDFGQLRCHIPLLSRLPSSLSRWVKGRAIP